MQLNIIQTPSVKELFMREIEAQILSGKAVIGEKLPTEREMAEQMHISRTTVNAGLIELQRRGFIDIHPRKGAYVADYLRNGNMDTLLAIINFSGGRFDLKVFRSLMEFRCNIECDGVYLAARHRTQDDIDRIDNICQLIEKGAPVEEMSGLTFKYHHELLCASGNYIYPMIFNAFREICILFSNNVFSKFSTALASEGIREILGAVTDQDGEKAAALMEKLIRARIDNLEESYPSFLTTFI